MTAIAYNPIAVATASPRLLALPAPSTPPGQSERQPGPSPAQPAASASSSPAAKALATLSQPVPGNLTQGEHIQVLALINRFRNLAREALGQGVISRHLHDDITAEITLAQAALVRINSPKE